MMEKKRTRAWRRHQARRVYKARLKYAAACRNYSRIHWVDFYGQPGSFIYKTTGTPCSCWLCRREAFDRLKHRKETLRIINEELFDGNQESVKFNELRFMVDKSVLDALKDRYVKASNERELEQVYEEVSAMCKEHPKTIASLVIEQIKESIKEVDAYIASK